MLLGWLNIDQGHSPVLKVALTHCLISLFP
jgi:hypothetical protein